MKQIFKAIRCYFLIIIPLINFYIFRWAIFRTDTQTSITQEIFTEPTEQRNPNEFLILDWTGNDHIFQESDRISCNFSLFNIDFCREKFSIVFDELQRTTLIDNCVRLSNLTVRWTKDRFELKKANVVSYHSQHIPMDSLPHVQSEQYSMVFTLESEAYSTSSIDLSWKDIDFAMWYNLERSFPEPATYFDVLTYLKILFSPIEIPFEKKITTSSIVWISSNCHSRNGRERFIQELMSYIEVDSFGNCLNNRRSRVPLRRRQDGKTNSAVYSSYKFVLAIENSNCEDYVTEKLIEAFASSSIPIVASRNQFPNYLRFAPKSSFINIYDFASVEDLAVYLNYLSNNQTAYNEYLWFHQTSQFLSEFSLDNLNDYLRLAEIVFGFDSIIYQWLLTKETGTNKYCKLIRFLHTNDQQTISQNWRQARPFAENVCLPPHDLVKHFDLS